MSISSSSMASPKPAPSSTFAPPVATYPASTSLSAVRFSTPGAMHGRRCWRSQALRSCPPGLEPLRL
eukprot:1055026-Pleurochrysis_carterae.AAC.1